MPKHLAVIDFQSPRFFRSTRVVLERLSFVFLHLRSFYLLAYINFCHISRRSSWNSAKFHGTVIPKYHRKDGI